MFQNEPMWAITAYFDPLGSGRRLSAYREFRRRLSIPLVAVELAFDGQFELGRGDADILIQLTGGSVLWQKERLLNVALESLPRSCDAVAWLDCDVVFVRDGWAAAARERLNESALVQPFERLYYLGPSEAPQRPKCPLPQDCFDSFAARFVRGTLPPEAFHSVGASRRFRYAPGMAWVARRHTLERHSFYDAGVIGGGDSLIRAAACGHQEERASALRMSSQQHRHYRNWAEPFHADVLGQISYVEGEALHLWHGDLADRRYKERYEGFERFRFDPNLDLAQTPEGVWKWNSDKPDLHAYVKEHFERQDQFWRASQVGIGA